MPRGWVLLLQALVRVDAHGHSVGVVIISTIIVIIRRPLGGRFVLVFVRLTAVVYWLFPSARDWTALLHIYLPFAVFLFRTAPFFASLARPTFPGRKVLRLQALV